jgi:hypothetical protein
MLDDTAVRLAAFRFLEEQQRLARGGGESRYCDGAAGVATQAGEIERQVPRTFRGLPAASGTAVPRSTRRNTGRRTRFAASAWS